jgi:hypothetical protein
MTNEWSRGSWVCLTRTADAGIVWRMRSLVILAVLAWPNNPKLAGRFVYAFTIEASGKVSRAAATAGTAESAPVDTCIVAAIKRIVFPRSSGPTTVSYPFNSSPA